MRRRGWIILLAVLLVLAGGLVLVDRIAAGVAADRVATKLGEHRPFTSKPSVHINGFPFLTQAMAGKYSDITVSGSGLSLPLSDGRTVSQVSFHAELHGVHLAASDALGGQVRELPVDRIAGEVTVPYAQLAALAGNDSTISRSGNDFVVTRSIQLPGLGTVRARGVGTLHVSGRQVSISVRSVKVGGVDVPQSLAQRAIDLLTPHLQLPQLPYQLKLSTITAAPGGVVVRGGASNVVLASTTGG